MKSQPDFVRPFDKLIGLNLVVAHVHVALTASQFEIVLRFIGNFLSVTYETG